MKYMKVLAVAAASALLTVALAGCSALSGGGSTVTDAYGRSVQLPSKVEKVATVGSGARFVVYAGAQDKLVAVTDMETKAAAARPYTIAYKDAFAALPSTSNGNHLMETSVDAEALLKIKPDVIISSRSAAECDALQKQIGIPVVGISYQDQLFSEDVYKSIEVVGKACGTSSHAEKVVASMKSWAKDLSDRTAKIADADKATVYVGAVNYKGAKSFGGTYQKYAPAQAVNVKNVADELGGTGSVEVDLEQLGKWNATYLFLNAGNMDLMKKDYEANSAFFQQLSAFRSGKLYTQPSFNMNGTNVEMGICDAYFIGATCYPDAFKDVDLAKKYDEIFSTMLGKAYYDTMKAGGMDFKQLSF